MSTHPQHTGILLPPSFGACFFLLRFFRSVEKNQLWNLQLFIHKFSTEHCLCQTNMWERRRISLFKLSFCPFKSSGANQQAKVDESNVNYALTYDKVQYTHTRNSDLCAYIWCPYICCCLEISAWSPHHEPFGGSNFSISCDGEFQKKPLIEYPPPSFSHE